MRYLPRINRKGFRSRNRRQGQSPESPREYEVSSNGRRGGCQVGARPILSIDCFATTVPRCTYLGTDWFLGNAKC
uniref:Uncharacterized protein n=1 Tax=Cucumis sativus TaxID=3659 RepID=A0A0A0LU45_CUCSA